MQASNQIRFRTQYRTEDLPDILRIENECFPPPIAYSRESLHHHFCFRGSIFFIAEDASGIVGFIFGDMHTRKPCGYIESLDVQPASQRRGIATQLLQVIESAFRDRGADCVRLEVQVSNAPAVTLYRKNGYQTERTIPKYYFDGSSAYELSKTL